MKKIILIVLLGLLVRVINIDSSSLALYGDELTIVLDAYSLLKTGHDQLGNFLPLTFPMGAGRPAGYVYGSIPFVALFGPTALGVRALSILSGLGIILLLYLIGKRMFSEKVGLLAAGIAAVSPWEISLSRGGFEAHFALFLALLGACLFMLAKQKPIFYVLSALSFGLTLHTYPTYKLSLLLFLPLLIWYQGGIKIILSTGKKYFFAGVILLLIIGILALSQTFIGGSEERFAGINIFSKGELKVSIEQKINSERQISSLPKNLVKYFHNKPIEYSKVFIENYLQNFSLDFLVLHGDRNPRHNMATMGEIYFIEIILILIGIFNLWQRQKRTDVFLILWLLLAALPAATVDLPHALRSSLMLPALIIFSAVGLMTIITYRRKKWLLIIFAVFIVQFIFFVTKLFFLAPNEYSNFWAYPAKLASEIALVNKDKYNRIILSDRIDNIEFAYPVYAKVEPAQIIDQNKASLLLRNKASLLLRNKASLLLRNNKKSSGQFKQYGNVYIGYIPDEEVTKLLEGLGGSALYIGVPTVNTHLSDYELIEGSNKQTALILKKISK